jgi:hypothetical protein
VGAVRHRPDFQFDYVGFGCGWQARAVAPNSFGTASRNRLLAGI